MRTFFLLQEDSTVHASLQIEKMNSLDYGSGMAYNFFYGYLRLVLPEVGIQSVKGVFFCASNSCGLTKYSYTMKDVFCYSRTQKLIIAF
jgi:hypothetical protein